MHLSCLRNHFDSRQIFRNFDNYFRAGIKAQKFAIDSVWWPHFDCTGYVCPDEKRPGRRSTPELIAIWEGRYEFRQLISEMVSTPIVKSVHTVMIAERDIHTPRHKFALNNGRIAFSFVCGHCCSLEDASDFRFLTG